MNQSSKKEVQKDQFLYLDRWVDKKYFRAFVYDLKGNQKLANSYNEYEDLITSGIWFDTKPNASQGIRKQKHGITSPDSK